MDQKQVRQWFIQWGQACIDEKQYLSDLDNAIGDGDHGFNMAKAFNTYFETVEKKEINSIQDEFKTLAMTLLSKVGGTAGPIYASAFLTMSKQLTDTDEIDHDRMVSLFEQGLESIQQRGKAQVGEKTLVDLWHPAIEALKNDELTNEKVDELVEATAPLKATKGRASYLGERSIGHIDPGSHSSGLCFKAYLDNRG